MRLTEFTDMAADAECRRLLMVLGAQRRVQNAWFGCESVGTIEFKADAAFTGGMRALFRYARGEAVPYVIVRDFLDDLLNLMFCGLGSNHLALPPFSRMADKPWALAWRVAELRMAWEGHETMDVPQMAHLLGIRQTELLAQIESQGMSLTDGNVPRGFLQQMLDKLNSESFLGDRTALFSS